MAHLQTCAACQDAAADIEVSLISLAVLADERDAACAAPAPASRPGRSRAGSRARRWRRPRRSPAEPGDVVQLLPRSAGRAAVPAPSGSRPRRCSAGGRRRGRPQRAAPAGHGALRPAARAGAAGRRGRPARPAARSPSPATAHPGGEAQRAGAARGRLVRVRLGRRRPEPVGRAASAPTGGVGQGRRAAGGPAAGHVRLGPAGGRTTRAPSSEVVLEGSARVPAA